MKEELIRVLNAKLDNIKVNIDSLTELNEKIDNEKGKLSYATEVLEEFKEDNTYNVLNFTKLSKDNFDKVVDILGENIKDMFGTSSCNYDGLVYLINGINSGVSLSLTLEQENAINYFIQGIEGKVGEYEAVIDGLMLVKDRFEICDVDVLKDNAKKYESIVNKVNTKDYVNEIDEVLEAINYNELDSGNTYDLLSFLLKYNAEVYEDKKVSNKVEVKEEPVDNIEFSLPVEEKEKKEENNDFEDFHFPEFENLDTKKEEVKEDDVILPSSDDEESIDVPEAPVEPEAPLPVIEPLPLEEGIAEINPETIESKISEDLKSDENADFKGIVNEDDYEEYNVDDNQKIELPDLPDDEVNEPISSRELQRLFKEFGVKKIDSNDELLTGNINNYRAVLTFLKNNDLINEFEKNEKLFVETLKNSTDEDLLDVVNVIKNELSVDEDDYKMTLKIAIETLPSIFVRENGNYENFVRNVKFFKDLGINLVSLFDFSKEVYVANHNNLLKNYDVVKNYNINLDYKNVKYMLMLPNIGEKLDYYVESVYPDRTRNNEKFDGITYINSYPNKLNIVEMETIKRLRYSSENSVKVFGNKPNSLAGEITNLKVNVLDINPEYMNKFFDNHFDTITSDEVREYARLCQNSTNVGNFNSELISLETYHNGLRYTINDINISYNKVIRNYNILRSYGIDKKKALIFAVCYNLVITNDEYMSLKNVLERDGE